MTAIYFLFIILLGLNLLAWYSSLRLSQINDGLINLIQELLNKYEKELCRKIEISNGRAE